MALTLKSKITAITDKFNLFDKTGVYDATTNPTGYGTPNISVGDVTSAHVTVTTPDETEVVIPIFTGGIITSLPSSLLNEYFEITFALLGVDKLEMGYYNFVYSIIYGDGGDEIQLDSKTCFFYFEPVACCMKKKIESIGLCDNPQEIDAIMTMKGLFEGMKANVCSGNKTKALAILKYLETQCNCCC